MWTADDIVLMLKTSEEDIGYIVGRVSDGDGRK